MAEKYFTLKVKQVINISNRVARGDQNFLTCVHAHMYGEQTYRVMSCVH